ncbi:Zn-ribbon domain-containing OB-fold protein [Bordetella sp. N]|uniref:Zn-ribbon domain-containing OB-fold protein n=1 Tax=Bordetella sp. N TaxID=1746199 RepID=UPI0009ECA073|nr:OB-fold domain-containing protein [Bordetella sp. N]
MTEVSAAGQGVERQYATHLAQGRFMIQQCAACARHVFPPRELCPHCDEDQLAWVAPSGQGTVYSTTTVARKAEAGGDYNVALIDLAEGVRLMTCVAGMDPATVCIGMAVRTQVGEGKDGPRVVCVAIAGSQG